MAVNDVKQSIPEIIERNLPIVYISDYDFVRVDEVLVEALHEYTIEEWSPACGFVDFETKEPKADISVEEYLEGFYAPSFGTPSSKVAVLKEIGSVLCSPDQGVKLRSLLLMIAQRELADPNYTRFVIIVNSTPIRIPDEISNFVTTIDLGMPNEDEIKEQINLHVKVNNANPLTENVIAELMPKLKGLTAFEVDRMLDSAMSKGGNLEAKDSELILRQKKDMVQKSGVLELVEVKEGLAIAGLEYLQEYLRNKAKVMQNLEDAKRHGVQVPKGVFIVGMPGCGKSLCAKVTAKTFGTSLLKLDMGSLMGKYVGESENNLRRAIRTAEAASPCILWIDEIEKAFSGVNGDNNDVVRRMFGYFLSWMQDKEKPVYVIATANNAEALPPELKRKGRFDEIFCVNLPNPEERKAIFELHLKKNKCAKNAQLWEKGSLTPTSATELGKATEGFNGADIEAVVNEGAEMCYLDGKKELTLEVLKKVISTTTSIRRSCGKQLDEMQKVFDSSSFRDATTGKLSLKKK